MLFTQLLSPIALRNGNSIAFRYLGKGTTYREFWETSNRFSYYLQKEIGQGLRVGLWMSNCPHIAYSFIALTNIKSCTVPFNPWATPEENIFKIKSSQVTVMLCSSDHTKSLKEFLRENGLSSINVIDMESKHCGEYDPIFSPPANHQPHENDNILLFYTHGTTGPLKGCLFNHKAVSQTVSGVRSAYKPLTSDVFFSQLHYSLPFSFIHYLLVPLVAGAGVYISDQRDPELLLSDLVQNRVTKMAPNPKDVLALLKTSEEIKLPLVTVKHFSLNGDALSNEVWKTLKQTTQVGVIQNYGLTEYLGSIAMGTPNHLAEESKKGWIGPALIGTQVRLMDENNEEVDKKKSQIGQIIVSGSSIMTRYLDLPDEQKQRIRGTWLYTGDMGAFDKEGNILFLERKADLITYQNDGNAIKVYPKPLESILYQLPQVQEAAFISIRDRTKNIKPAVVIVRKPQAPLHETEVLEWMRPKLPNPLMLPDFVFFVDTVPRTYNGGINRAKLRGMFEGS